MAEPRFGKAFDRLVARGDTRGTGGPAPSGSGNPSAFASSLAQNREDFQLPTDLLSPQQRQQALLAEINVNAPKSMLDKSVLAGTKWGVIDIGGVKMVNPVKSFFSGLEFVNEEVASPISGYVIGNAATSLAQITNWSSAGKIAEDFKKKMDATDGGFWEARTALKEFNEERDALFWGEKFISAMVFDPTSYIGFGWAMKMPKLFKVVGLGGKKIPILGPLEKGWIDGFNFPFSVGARAYRGESLFRIPNFFGKTIEPSLPGALGRGVPLSSSQKAAAHANKVFDDSSEFMRRASGKNLETMTKADITPAMAEVLDPAVPYNLLPDNEARRMRDILWENEKVTGAAAERLIADVGGTTQVARYGAQAGKNPDNAALKEVVSGLQQNGSTLADDVGARYAMSDVRDWYVSGRLNLDEASEQLARITGAPIDEASMKTFNSWLKNTARATHSRAQALVNDDNPRGIIEQLRSQSSNTFKADAQHGFHERMQQLGTIGSFINKGDKLQNALYQRGLRKWVIQPMSRAVLTFAAFPLQERMETMIRTGLGQGRLGSSLRNSARYNKNVAGNWNVPSSLSREGKNIAGQRAAVNRQSALADPDAPFGSTPLFEDIARHMVGNKLINKVGDAVNDSRFGEAIKWLNPDHWNQKANQWSAEGRRMFHEQAVIKEHVSLYANDGSLKPFRDYLSQTGSIPTEVSDELVNQMATAGLTGRGDAVRALKEDWTGSVLQDLEIDNVINGRFASDELHSSSRDIIDAWRKAGNTKTSSVDRVVDQIIDNEYDQFLQGLGGFQVSMDISMGQVDEALGLLKAVPLAERTADDILMAEGSIKAGLQAVDGMEKQISQTLSRATKRARETAFNNTKRQEILRNADKRVNNVMALMQSRKQQYIGQLKALEMEAFDGKVVGMAAAGEKKLDITIAGWKQDRAAVEQHFADWGDKPKTQGFYNDLSNIRDEIQTTMQQSQFEADALLENTVTRARTKRGIETPVPDFNKLSTDLAAKDAYSIDDLAAIVGQNNENVTQAMMKGVWLNKDDFANYYMIRGANNGVKGLDSAKIGDVYARLQQTFAIDDKVGMHFMQTKHNMRQFGSDLKNAAKAPSFRPEQETATANFIEGFAQMVDGQSDEFKSVMQAKGQVGVDQATEQTNRAFVNYDGQTAVDQTMQAFFPFWTYESRRVPYLLRTSATNPVVWNTFGPEGNYWSETDDGYVHPAVAPWMDINIFGGTLMNAPRRMKKGEMQPEHEGGVRGFLSGAEEQIGQVGFYLGPHMTFAMDAFMQGDLAEAAGQSAPPPLTGGLAMAAFAVASTPGLEPLAAGLQKMRTAVLPDKFRDYEASKIIWEMNLNPADVDFDKWKPRPGRENFISQEQINEALRRSAGVEWIREISGMVRYRGDSERTYRAERDRIQMEWTGLTKAELDEAKKQKIPLTSIVPMPPKVGRILQELEGGEQFNASVALLSTGEKARIQELSREMWESYDALKVDADAQQAADDAKWLSGEMGASVWRDNMSSRKQSIGGFIDQIRGFRRDPLTGEKVDIDPAARYKEVPTTFEEYGELQKKLGNDTIRIQHPTSQALEMYHGIAPVDRDGDGVPEWDEFFKAREALLGQLPPELRREVMSEIEEKQTEAERELGRMQRGVLGTYWGIDDQVKEEMGLSDLVESLMLAERTDPETANALRKLPAMARYRKEVQRRKDLLRLATPELDYALNIFGFTGKTLRFKNPQARLWWERGNGVQKQVPFFGNLTGNEAP